MRINRHGEFTTKVTPGLEVQCGHVGATTYKYHVTIEATDSYMTQEGYVADNFEIFKYFQKFYANKDSTSDSCEMIAKKAVLYFLNLFLTKKELVPVDLRRIYVRIDGAEVSFIEADWSRERDGFPVQA